MNSFRSETRVLLPHATGPLAGASPTQCRPGMARHLVQAPLPRGMIRRRFTGQSPSKDVDGFHPSTSENFPLGSAGFVPALPGILELLVRSRIPLDGAEVVILGRGNIVGKPMAAILVKILPPIAPSRSATAEPGT